MSGHAVVVWSVSNPDGRRLLAGVREMADYIPAADAALIAWSGNFTAYVTVNAGAMGLVPADVLEITGSRGAFDQAFTSHLAALSTSQGAREQKELTKRVLKDSIRRLVRRLQASSGVTDAQRQALGLRVVTGAGRALVPAPATRPVGVVDTSQRLRHTLRFADELLPPGRRARPANVSGCEVWQRVGDVVPVDGTGCVFIGRATRSRFVVDYLPDDAGKTAHYVLRWVTARGDAGPWSAVVSASIPR